MNFSGQCQTVFPSGCVILQSQSQRRSRAAGTFLILPVSRGGATGYPRLRAIGLDGDGLAGAEEPLPSEVTLEQRLGEGEGAGHEENREKRVPGRGTRCAELESGVSPAWQGQRGGPWGSGGQGG